MIAVLFLLILGTGPAPITALAMSIVMSGTFAMLVLGTRATEIGRPALEPAPRWVAELGEPVEDRGGPQDLPRPSKPRSRTAREALEELVQGKATGRAILPRPGTRTTSAVLHSSRRPKPCACSLRGEYIRREPAVTPQRRTDVEIMPKKRGLKKHSPHRDGAPYAWAIWRNGEIVARIIDATRREALEHAAKLDREEASSG